MIRSAYRIAFMICALTVGSITAYGSSIVDTCRGVIHEVRKDIHHEIQFAQGGDIDISNKYGMLDIHTWDKSEVHLDAQIIVRSDSKSAAEAKLNNIEIQFDLDGDHLEIATVFGEDKKSWWSSMWNNEKAEIEINYIVYLPKTTHLNISNKYGNTSLDNMNNDCSISMKYGDFSGKNIDGNVDIYVGYGKAIMGNIGSVKAEINYSLFKADSAMDVDMESKYSKCYIDKCLDIVTHSKYDYYSLGTIGDLVNEGKYDTYRIESARSANISSKYSEVKINYLEKSLEADMRNGLIKVLDSSPVMEDVTIEGKYTDIYLKMANDFQYYIESKYATPRLSASCYNTSVEEDGQYSMINGYRGSRNAKAIVSINTKYGSVKID